MKKWLLATVLGATMIFASACGGGSNQGGSSGGSDNEKNEVIKVGASPVPHAEILEEAKPLLEKKGYKLKIENSLIMYCRIKL